MKMLVPLTRLRIGRGRTFRTMAMVIETESVRAAKDDGSMIDGLLVVGGEKNTSMTICIQKNVVTTSVTMLMTIRGVVFVVMLVLNIVNPLTKLSASGTLVRESTKTVNVAVISGDCCLSFVYPDRRAVLLPSL